MVTAVVMTVEAVVAAQTVTVHAAADAMQLADTNAREVVKQDVSVLGLVLRDDCKYIRVFSLCSALIFL